LVSTTGLTPNQALDKIEGNVIGGIRNVLGENSLVELVAVKIFDCLCETLLPLLFPDRLIECELDNGVAGSTLQSTTPIIQQNQLMTQQQSLSLQPSLQQNTNPIIPQQNNVNQSSTLSQQQMQQQQHEALKAMLIGSQ
jgi:hypothetical protein